MLTFYKLLLAIATTAQAAVAPAPVKPLTATTGRPACGNVMGKSRGSMKDCQQVATTR